MTYLLDIFILYLLFIPIFNKHVFIKCFFTTAGFILFPSVHNKGLCVGGVIYW